MLFLAAGSFILPAQTVFPDSYMLLFLLRVCTRRVSYAAYTKRKGLTINTAKSEVMHFNLHSLNVPAFSVDNFCWPTRTRSNSWARFS